MGNVRNDKTGKILKPRKYKNGYLNVLLTNNDGEKFQLYVHRLVAKAFIPNSDNLPEVDHINNIRNCNIVTNLQWVSHEDNIRLAVERRNNMEEK